MLLTVAPRRLQRHAPTLIGALLIIAMSISLAWQTLDWMRLLRTPTPSASVEPQAAQEIPAPQQLATLFGSGSPLAGDAAPPATDLRLTLHGSFVHADPQRSSAIVQREGSQPQRYAIGSELDSGIKLHAVYRDRIELERNGRLETLLFPARSQAQSSQSSQSSQSDMPPSESSEAFEDLDNLELENAELLRQRMTALRQQLQEGIEPDDSDPNAPTDLPMESD